MNEAPATTIVPVERLLLRIEMVAELLSISRRTAERLVVAGRLPDPIRLGRLRLWRMADLKAFVADGCRREATQ